MDFQGRSIRVFSALKEAQEYLTGGQTGDDSAGMKKIRMCVLLMWMGVLMPVEAHILMAVFCCIEASERR